MAKEKAEERQAGLVRSLAQRRRRNKLRASEMEHRVYEGRLKERTPPGAGGG